MVGDATTPGTDPAKPTADGIIDLDELAFAHRVVVDLPADNDSSNRPRPVSGAVFTRVRPTPVARPSTLLWSPEVAALLGLAHDVVESQDFAAVFSGNRIPVGADPHATVYGGHQFGNWAGQLGDGRAINLGEVLDTHGSVQSLQLKGAGPTPYSRGADGRAVLRSSMREFLCSEAMHHLGVPTTRALSLVATGEEVVRDMLYDGNPRPEPGAVVCRVAPSFIRFGHFQLPSARGDLELTRQILEHTIRIGFPHLRGDQIIEFFADVVDRTISLVIDWMRIGFVHGVLNTDNMSILGLTIDYGPYGWLESFDPNWTPNTTDAAGRRYRFGSQPSIALWNLAQLANALVPLGGSSEPFQEILDTAAESSQQRFITMMARRLGWRAARSGDEGIIDELFSVLSSTETDYLIFCRNLAQVSLSNDATDDELLAPLGDAWYEPISEEHRRKTLDWLRSWSARTRAGGGDDPAAQINSLTPRFVLRNYLAQQAIDAAERGDLDPARQLLDVLRRPYSEQPGYERFAQRRPEWARSRVGCSMLSCSS